MENPIHNSETGNREIFLERLLEEISPKIYIEPKDISINASFEKDTQGEINYILLEITDTVDLIRLFELKHSGTIALHEDYLIYNMSQPKVPYPVKITKANKNE